MMMMAKYFTLVIIMLLAAGGKKLSVNGQDQHYCIARPSASEEELIANIEYACSNIGDDCKMIQPSGVCFFPDTLIFHASFVMNQYYAKNGRTESSCYFGNTGLISYYQPYRGSETCTFA